MKEKLNTIEEAGWSELAKYQAAGWQFEWFARDIDGHLAVLNSAGEGPIPGVIWNHLREYNALATRINSLPTNESKLVFKGGGYCQDWLDYAGMGLFAFDYHDAKLGGYELMARPTSPVNCSALGTDLVSWLPVLNIAFTRVTFIRDATVAGSIYRPFSS